MKKSLIIMICVLLCMFAFTAGVSAATPAPWDGTADTSWYNTTDTSFNIDTPEKLAGLAKIVNGTAEGIEKDNFDGKRITLTADLNLGGVKADDGTWSGQSWTPIGKSTTDNFRGSFNGNGKTISNLYINSADSYVGLFGAIDGNALVKNLIISSGSITTTGSYAGGITGYMSSSALIYNSGTSCDVNGADYVGGVVGRMNGTMVKVYDTFNAGDVKTKNIGGGIVGYVQTTVSDVYNRGDVENIGTSASAPVGGIAGQSTNAGKFINCYSTGTVKSVENATNIGSMVGLGWVRTWQVQYCSFTNSYYEKTVDGMLSLGGITDERSGVTSKTAAEMKECASSLGASFVSDNTDAPVNDGYPILAWQVKKADGSYSFVDNWDDYAATEFAGGEGTYAKPYLVANAEQLALVAKQAASGQTQDVYYKQTADIDLAGHRWNGIGAQGKLFRGNYDGDNFEIKNLYINSSSANMGLFGYISYADLINIRLTDVDVTGGSYLGALVGYSTGSTIANCHVLSGSVSGGSAVGGLIGVFYPAGNNHNELLAPDFIVDSSSVIDVNGGGNVGGLIGSVTNFVSTASSTNPGTGRKGNILIENCYATGDVTATNGSVGGLIGNNGPIKQMVVEHCYASGNVIGAGTQKVGGLVGSSGFGSTGISDSLTYRNNVVLSSSLSGLDDGAVYGRITGLGIENKAALKVVLENNYALASMTLGDVAVESDDAASYNGASVSAEKLAEQATWEALGFDFSEPERYSPDVKWQWDEEAKRPVLRDGKTVYRASFKTQPHDAIAYADREVTFIAEAGKGVGTLSYDWQVSRDEGKTWTSVNVNLNSSELVRKGNLNWDGNWYRCMVTDSTTYMRYYSDIAVLNVVESDLTPAVAASELYAVYQQDLVTTAKAPIGLYSISGDIADQDVTLYFDKNYNVSSHLSGNGLRPWAAIDWMAQGNDPSRYLKIDGNTGNFAEVDLIGTFLDMQNELGTGAFVSTNGLADKDFIMSNLYYFLALDIYYQGAEEWGNENEEGTTGRDAAIEYLLSLTTTDKTTECEYFNYVAGQAAFHSNLGIYLAPVLQGIYACDFVTIMSRLADDPVYGERVRGLIYSSMDELAYWYERDAGGMTGLAVKTNTVACAKYLSALVAAADVAGEGSRADAYNAQAKVVYENLLNARAYDGTYTYVTNTSSTKLIQTLPVETGNMEATAAVAMALGDYANGRVVLAEMNYERGDQEYLVADMNRIEIPSVVLSDLELPLSGFNGSVYTWSSSNESILSSEGKVNRPVTDTVVTLTVKGVYGTVEMEQVHTVTVPSARGDGGDEVYADSQNINLLPEYIYDIELPTVGENGSAINWSSSDENVISTDGKVNRPAIGEEDAYVTLTAEISKGEASETKEFKIKVWAQVDTTSNEGMVKEAYYQIRYTCMTKKVLETYWDAWVIYGALGEEMANFDYVYRPGGMGSSLGGNILAIICMGDNPYNCNGVNYIERLDIEGVTGGTWAEPTFRIMAAEAAGMGDPRSNNMGTQISWFSSIDHGTDLAGWACVPVSRHIDDQAAYRDAAQKFINAISTDMAGGSADKTLSAGCVVTGLSALYAVDLEFKGIEGLDVTTDEPWVSQNWLAGLYNRVQMSFGSDGDGFGGQVQMEFVDLYNTLYKDGNVAWISCGVTKDKLDAQIEKANIILENKDDYTADSIKTIEKALALVDTIPESELTKEIAEYGEEYYTLYDAVRYAKLNNAPVVDETALDEAKAAAAKDVETAFAAYNSDDYSASNWDELVKAKENGLMLINAAKDEKAVADAKADALAAMAAVPVSSDASKIEVTFRLIGATKSSQPIDFDEAPGEYYGSEYQNWIKTTTYKVDEGYTVYDVLAKALKDNGMTQTGGSNGYVASVTAPEVLGGETMSEFTNGLNSGWMYTVNGIHPSGEGAGVKEYVLKDGDAIVFHYVNDFKYEDESTNPESEYLNKWLEVPDVASGTPDEPTELPFTDIPDAWYQDAVRYVYENGIMNGMTETTFEPGTTLSRAMFITMLYRMDGETAVSGDLAYTDVKADFWYTDAIIWGTEAGIINGYGDGIFRPDGLVTRQEMAKMMYCYAEYKGMDMTASAGFDSFNDGDQVASWAAPYMSWVVGSELMKGDSNGNLNPAGNATRAEAATVMMRFAETLEK